MLDRSPRPTGPARPRDGRAKNQLSPLLRPAEEKIEKKIVYYRKVSYDWKIAANESLPGDAAGGFDSRLRNGPEGKSVVSL
jgi:hypothetical protein